MFQNSKKSSIESKNAWRKGNLIEIWWEKSVEFLKKFQVMDAFEACAIMQL